MCLNLLCTSKAHASTPAENFILAFQEYLDSAISEIKDCKEQDCYDKMDIPVARFDSMGGLVYWNVASMHLALLELDQGIAENESEAYSIFTLGGTQFYIPIYYHDRNRQRSFLLEHIGEDFEFANYSIKSKNVDPTQVSAWLTELNVDRVMGRGSIILYFLLLIISLLLVLRYSSHLIRLFGDWIGSTVVILILTCVRLIFSLPFVARYFNRHDIFQYQVNTSLLSPSLGELFINMLLFFVITIFLFKTFDNRPTKKYNKFTRWYLLITGYLLVMTSIVSFVYVVKRVVVHSPISFQFDKIYALDWNTHIFILSILLFISSLFFLSYLLIKILSTTGAKLGQRLIAFFIATLITFPLFLKFDLHVSAFGFYALVLCMIVLMDLFVETRQKSISWLVMWLVTISTGTTSLLYTHNSIASFNKGELLAQQIGEAYESDELISSTIIENPEQFKWAVYSGYDLKKQWGNPPLNLINPANIPAIGLSKLINEYKQRSIIYRYTPGISVVINKPQNTVIQFISLFSFLFTSLTIVVILILLLNTIFKFLPDTWNLSIKRGTGIRRKIQYVIFGVLLLSFATVFAVTSFYLRDLRSTATNELSSNQRLGLHYFAEHLAAMPLDSIDANYRNNWDHLDANFNLYSTAGQVFDPSSKTIFYRPPFELVSSSQHSTSSDIVTYQLGNWSSSFQRIWVHGKEFVIAAIEEKNEGDENYFVNNLLGTLMNLYIFLFVIASSIALTFSDSITRPLLKLREKFSSVKIGYSNERIDWKSNDELGQLIHDYNSMLSKIEDSVNTLAMTERELAWREMAKQVAHEIKNPLTPMKLSLQHLQLAIKRDPHRAEELINRVGKTLLEQIDNLSHIASEFSNFAQMPKPENKQVILNDVASSVHDLFRKREDMDINLYIPIDEIYVFGDRHYMTRVLINLLKNAIQAIPTERRGTIDIHVYKENDNAVIKVMDNGTGIPEEIRDKVFQPNFTSKNSGTGLGLPICANIVESFNGKMYFETEVDKGTTFFIEIPLMHTADNFKKEKHVIL